MILHCTYVYYRHNYFVHLSLNKIKRHIIIMKSIIVLDSQNIIRDRFVGKSRMNNTYVDVILSC